MTDNKIRCAWCEKDELYTNYHDQEWGRWITDERLLFEFLILEGFQAGLSWHTILKKREHFRNAFDNFQPKKIVHYTQEKVNSLLNNENIIRNKLKIQATITNASAFLEIQKEFGSFANYLSTFIAEPIDNCPKTLSEVPSFSPLSDNISKDLKKRGFKFVGTTIIYSFLQATGRINDHIEECWTRT
ncbi:MAG: DNA-3-methyladenine glycosylase I [Capnocytophaga sp.]|nr:DNA-3-methyladenine glycosylase I [Capnocytophaga sp.]